MKFRVFLFIAVAIATKIHITESNKNAVCPSVAVNSDVKNILQDIIGFSYRVTLGSAINFRNKVEFYGILLDCFRQIEPGYKNYMQSLKSKLINNIMSLKKGFKQKYRQNKADRIKITISSTFEALIQFVQNFISKVKANKVSDIQKLIKETRIKVDCYLIDIFKCLIDMYNSKYALMKTTTFSKFLIAEIEKAIDYFERIEEDLKDCMLIT